MKGFIIRFLSIFFVASFSSVLFWYYFAHSDSAFSSPSDINQNPADKNDTAASQPLNVQNLGDRKENRFIGDLLANYSTSWKKQEENFQTYRLLLGQHCNAISNAVLTQSNSPMGTNITYDANSRRKKEVTPALFKLFLKETPFKKAPWDTCAVVGNGGILANSKCGRQIDSATYVIRCNLPPLNNGHERDTGSKTNFVTANPSILFREYRGLKGHRQSFVEDIQLYGDALLLLPAFSYPQNTAVCLRAFSSIEEFGNRGPHPVFFNPAYLTKLAKFWRSQGIRFFRLSTGIMMASLAVELCNNVHLYGFWPFRTHPYTYQPLTNHYFDNRQANNRVHAMPAEFKALMNLHRKGVIHLHLGECTD